MIAVRAVGRTLVESSVAIGRIPVDLVARVLPDGPTGPRQAVLLAADTVEGTVLSVVGALLRDPDLRTDGERQLAAARQRKDAMHLRGEAAARRTDAEERLAEEKQAAEQRRVEAGTKAAKATKAAKRDAEQRKAEVAEAATKQEQQIDEHAQAREAAVEDAAKEARLDVLDERADALDAEADARTAADEADRLEHATAAAKADRKQAG